MHDQTRSDRERASQRPNVLARLWKRTGLRFSMFMLALKGAIPPTVAIAAYQAPAWSSIYTTRGYFVAVIALLSMAMQPRAKFLQTIFTLAVFISLAAAVNLLMIFCAVTARDSGNNQGLHTGSSGSIEATPYDSSANAVAAAWLFVNVFASTFLKAKRPQMAIAALQYNIYSITASIYAPSFPTLAAGLSFSRRLLITFLTGYGIATVVNILIWPVTSREEVKSNVAELISGLKSCLEAYQECTDSFRMKKETDTKEDTTALVSKLREQSHATSDLFGEIKLELDFARKEIAYGHLHPDNLHQLYVGMREVLQPIMGLVTVLQMFANLRLQKDEPEMTNPGGLREATRDLKEDEWRAVLTTLRDRHDDLHEVMIQGLEHISLQLKLTSSKRRKGQDPEQDVNPQPGAPGFAEYLERQLHEHQLRHARLAQAWVDSMGQDKRDAERRQQQLRLVLYLNFLLYNAGRAVLRQVQFADGLVADGAMRRRRLICPTFKALGQLMMGGVMDRDQDEAMGASPNNGSNIWVGDMFSEKKDPEHLAPANAYEKITNCLRDISRALSSADAGFGLRAAVATLSIALAAFLASSRPFFLEQRGIWAVSMTAIALIPQLGASISAFCMRLMGVAAAVGISIAIFYIADQTRPAIIVLFFLQSAGWLLLSARFPSFELTGIVGGVSVIVIVGYQLQVETIGVAASTSNGQAYYPIYFLALYRLAAIAIGIAVAFFWSVFPFPVSSHGSLRRDTSSTLYLLANYHSCIHATLDIYPRLGPAIAGLPDDHPVKRLDEARQEVFGRSLLMLSRLRDHLAAVRYEPRIGGRFPHEQYENVVETLSHIFTHLTLMTYSSKAFVQESECQVSSDEETDNTAAQEEQNWLKDLNGLIAREPFTSHELTSTLLLLAASLHNGQPLPPHFSRSTRHALETSLSDLAPGNTDPRRFTHPCYAAFVVNRITSSLVRDEVAKLGEQFKGLVGEVEFNFHDMSGRAGSMDTLVNTYSSRPDALASSSSTKVKEP